MTPTAPAYTYRVLAIALALITTAAPAQDTAPTVATLTGLATRAKDGDGVLFGAVEVRLQGIASPEDRRGAPRTPEGRAATAALDALVRGRLVSCDLDGTTASSGRPVGVCRVDGVDLGAAMVLAGHARDCLAYSLGAYADEEARAIAEGRDLAATYQLPGYCAEPTP